jgi:hypothetical protein
MNMESRGVSIGEKKHTKLNFWNETQRYHVRCRLRREIMIVRNWRRIEISNIKECEVEHKIGCIEKEWDGDERWKTIRLLKLDLRRY